MLVFFQERLVLLSMPKTGSTALHLALADRADMVISNPPALKHAPVYRYNRFLRPMFKNVCDVEMELVAVMREPVSWLGSWFRYRQRPGMEGHPNSTHGMGFDDFVTAYCQGSPPAFADVGSQERFLRAQPNGTAVRHLFRYADQARLLAFLSDRLGPIPALPRVNESPKGNAALSSEVARKLRRKHAEAFALYDAIGTGPS